MANTDVSIANLALTMLSTSRILALNQDDENARKVNAIYEQTRDSLLTEHNWNFARAQASLARLDSTPVVEDYAYIYQIPIDCLRVIRTEGDTDFIIVSNTLYSNESSMVIEYIKQETDASKFSPGFVRAFAARLAADLAFGITQNATLAQGMEVKAIQALKEAKWTDAQEGGGTVTIQSSLIDARKN